RRGQHRRRADLDFRVPLQLGALVRARGRGARVPAGPRRRALAAVGDGLRGSAPDRVERDRGGTQPEPARRARDSQANVQPRRVNLAMRGLLKNKIVLVALGVLVVAGVAYKFALAPKPKPAKKKIDGALVTLGDPFTVNLAGGHYGRITVAVLLAEAPPVVADPTTAPPLPQFDAVRAVVTDDLTGIDPSRLI